MARESHPVLRMMQVMKVELPVPTMRGDWSLEQTIAMRRSARAFATTEIPLPLIGQLCWAAQGTTGRGGLRTTPSAGRLHPLAVHVALPRGVYRYLPETHTLVRRTREDARYTLFLAGFEEPALASAPAVFSIVSVSEAMRARYPERADRFIHLEAGHAAQNLLLQATALGLGAVPIGRFDETSVESALSLAPCESPLYLLPVGRC